MISKWICVPRKSYLSPKRDTLSFMHWCFNIYLPCGRGSRAMCARISALRVISLKVGQSHANRLDKFDLSGLYEQISRWSARKSRQWSATTTLRRLPYVYTFDVYTFTSRIESYDESTLIATYANYSTTSKENLHAELSDAEFFVRTRLARDSLESTIAAHRSRLPSRRKGLPTGSAYVQNEHFRTKPKPNVKHQGGTAHPNWLRHIVAAASMYRNSARYISESRERESNRSSSERDFFLFPLHFLFFFFFNQTRAVRNTSRRREGEKEEEEEEEVFPVEEDLARRVDVRRATTATTWRKSVAPSISPPYVWWLCGRGEYHRYLRSSPRSEIVARRSSYGVRSDKGSALSTATRTSDLLSPRQASCREGEPSPWSNRARARTRRRQRRWRR